MKKKLAIIISLVVVLTTAIGGTFAWFFSQSEITGRGKAGIIELYICATHTIVFENVLPGEPIDTSGNIIWYNGNRPAILQYKLVGSGTLRTGAESHTDWLNLSQSLIDLDYKLNANGVNYDFTDHRMNEILSMYENTVVNEIYKFPMYPSTYDPNTIYTYVERVDIPGIYNVAALVGLKFTGEFGGMYKGSPSRQFEQGSIFNSVGIQVTAVQVTPEAIEDLLGVNARKDVEDMVAAGLFNPPEEWYYTG